MSPKKVVGCRGGSRYVEGCWGFLNSIFRFSNFQLSFSNLKFANSQISNFQMFTFPNCQFSMFPNVHFQYSIFKFQISKFQIVKKQTKTKTSKMGNSKTLGTQTFRHFHNFRSSDMKEEYFPRMFPYFLVFLKYIGDKYGARGYRFGELVGRSKNVPKNIAIDQESLIANLGIIETL